MASPGGEAARGRSSPYDVEVTNEETGVAVDLALEESELSYAAFIAAIAHAFELDDSSSNGAAGVPPLEGFSVFYSGNKKLHDRSNIKAILSRVQSFVLRPKDFAPASSPPSYCTVTGALFPKTVTVALALNPDAPPLRQRFRIGEKECSHPDDFLRAFSERFLTPSTLAASAAMNAIREDQLRLVSVDTAAGKEKRLVDENSLKTDVLNGLSFIVERKPVEDTSDSPTTRAELEPLLDIASSWKECVKSPWVCATGHSNHDFFLSHRQSSESSFVETVFYHVASTLPGCHSYWDRKCIRPGERWVSDFITGLSNSKIAVLFCSEAALQKVKQADLYPDNMLLEWELALKLSELPEYRIQLALVLVGQETAMVDPVSGVSQLVLRDFNLFNHNLFPDNKHAHPLSPKELTVRQVVKRVLDLQGIKGDPRPGNSDELITRLEKLRAKLDKSPDQITVLSSSETSSALRSLRHWLTPLDEDMRAQRQNILRSYVEGTRRWLLDDVAEAMFADTRPEERVTWLRGSPGVGKSVMAALVAREYEKQNQLAAMFFCKHDDDKRRDPRRLICTLAYFLAEWNDTFAASLVEIKAKRPDLLSCPLSELFDEIVCKPLSGLHPAPTQPIVIVVDALDECGTLGKRGLVLDVFARQCRALPAFVKMFVTSREEPDIVAAFKGLLQTELAPTAEQNVDDLEIFVSEFLRGHASTAEAVQSGPSLIVEAAEGIFVWAVLACQALVSGSDEIITLPMIHSVTESHGIGTMDHIADTVASPTSSYAIHRASSEMAKMDAIFDATFNRLLLSSETSDSLFSRLVATLAIAREPASARDWARILDENYDELAFCVRRLKSVLVIDPDDGKVQFFHKSIVDYLVDPTRCGVEVLQISPEKRRTTAALLALGCLKIMRKSLKFNICGMAADKFYEPVDFEALRKQIPTHLQYACLHAGSYLSDVLHSTPSPGSVQTVPAILSAIDGIARNHLTHWMELLSSLRRFDQFVPAVTSVLSFHKFFCPRPPAAAAVSLEPSDASAPSTVAAADDADTSHLLSDAYRTALLFHSPIATHPLQTYFSAVPASPLRTPFRSAYLPQSLAIPATLPDPRAVVIPDFRLGLDPDWTACFAVMLGHAWSVVRVAFSPDGTVLASASADGTVVLWNVATGQQLNGLKGHSADVFSVAFSPDGRTILTASWDSTARLWDAENGEEIQCFKGHATYVTSAAFSPDASTIVTGSWDKTLRLWETATGHLIKTISGHDDFIWSVTFSPDGRTVASVAQGTHDRSARVWDVETGIQVARLDRELSWRSPVTFGSDGQDLILATIEKTIIIWDFTKDEITKTLVGHTDEISSVSLVPDGTGNTLLSLAYHTTALIWDIKLAFSTATDSFFCFSFQGRPVKKLSAFGGVMFGLAVSRDGVVALGSRDRTVRLFNLSLAERHEDTATTVGECTAPALPLYHTTSIEALAFSTDHTLLASGDSAGFIRLWDVESGRHLSTLTAHSRKLYDVQFSFDGEWLLSGSVDKTAKMWRVADSHLKVEVRHQSSVTATTLTRDNKTMLTGTIGTAITAWDVETGEPLRKITGHLSTVGALVLSADGGTLASVGYPDGVVHVWNALTGALLFKLHADADVTSIWFSDDSHVLYAATATEEFQFEFTEPVNEWTSEMFQDAGRSASWSIASWFGGSRSPVPRTVDVRPVVRRKRDVYLDSGGWLVHETPGRPARRVWVAPDLAGEEALVRGDVVALGAKTGRVSLIKW
ncbi:WD40-repeat-containing domain protein [Zopfochytrium polystomum]|nr:WD40-repeat-containing domain protein [Zopfochytrium polystomum]